MNGMILRFLNLSLLVLFPVAWFAPLMRAGLLPLFGLSEISVVTGLRELWEADPALTLLISFLAIIAPYMKTIGLASVQFGLMGREALPVLIALGKLAMADVFLVALYIVIVRGVGRTTVETAWGLYLFTGCVLLSFLIGHLTARR